MERLSRRYFRLAVASLFLIALLQGLSFVFFTLFFWPALGFGIIAFYYRRAAKNEEEAKTAQWHDPDISSPPGNNKRMILIVIASALSLLVIISSLFSSKKSEETSINESAQAEPEEQEEGTGSSGYARAFQEFNNQNYRPSIVIARKALMADPGNNDLLLVLGDDYGALKQYDSAFIWFDRAYQNGARSAYLSHWLGYLYDNKGSISQGIQFYKEALQQDSGRVQIYDRLAELEPEKAAWYKKKSGQWAEKK